MVALGGEQIPDVAAQENGIPPPALVGRHGDRGVGGRHDPPRLGVDERLIAEPHHHPIGTEAVGGRHSDLQRRRLSVRPARVGHDDGVRRHRGRQIGDGGLGAGHHDEVREVRSCNRPNGVHHDRVSAESGRQLVALAGEP